LTHISSNCAVETFSGKLLLTDIVNYVVATYSGTVVLSDISKNYTV